MRLLFLLLLALLSPAAVLAELALDPAYADHMVLQQGKPIIVTGTTDRVDRDIAVVFNGKRATAFIHKNRWMAELPPMPASARGRDLTVRQGAESVKITDVLLGEVWIAAGQSNMLFHVDETDNAKEIIARATNPLLRLRHSEPRPYVGDKPFPESELALLNEGRMFEGQWAECTPQSVPRMSAVGYLFASRLQKALGVPVGIIDAAVGGSEMICWVPERSSSRNTRKCWIPPGATAPSSRIGTASAWRAIWETSSPTPIPSSPATSSARALHPGSI